MAQKLSSGLRKTASRFCADRHSAGTNLIHSGWNEAVEHAPRMRQGLELTFLNLTLLLNQGIKDVEPGSRNFFIQFSNILALSSP